MDTNTLKDIYSIAVTIIAIISTVIAIYNKIKFACLEKASEMVASAEGRTDLTGTEKFALVVMWINQELPKVFKITAFQTILANIIQFAYDTSIKYAKKFVKNKTGLDISDIIKDLESEFKKDEKETVAINEA